MNIIFHLLKQLSTLRMILNQNNRLIDISIEILIVAFLCLEKNEMIPKSSGLLINRGVIVKDFVWKN
jgi:hypothetical protein